MRTDAISDQLHSFLERYSPPRNLAGNERALQAELDELLRVLLTIAPTANGYVEWTIGTLRTLSERMQTRSWPTVGELYKVAMERRPKPFKTIKIGAAESDRSHNVQIMARRMKSGEAVGEEWLYGRCALELVASGLVSDETLRKYQSALWSATNRTPNDGKA